MEKDCVFQYATSDGIIRQDTNLITSEEAEELFEKYKPQFRKDLEDGRSPQMCIWVDMDSRYNFRTIGKELDASNMEIRDGQVYQVILINI